MPDDGNLYEVIDGELFVTPFPKRAHQRVVSRLLGILEPYVFDHDLGEVYAPGLKVVLDEQTGVGPDIVFVSKSRLAGGEEDGFYGAPDLIIEVVSSKPQLDRVVKFKKYASSGVPHYWIADPKARVLEVFRLEGARYRRIAELKDDATLEHELFSGLRIALGDVWP